MKKEQEIKGFIESGILEVYVLGQANAAEEREVEAMCAAHPEVGQEIEAISRAMESYAEANAMPVEDPTVETFLMATIDYMERLRNGEQPSFPPMLEANSKPADYAQWLNRPDLALNTEVELAHARLIGHTPEMTTAIVWLKYGAPPETHTSQLEKFLVLEGTCDITIGEEVHSMAPGDTLSIPLHIPHQVRVTSQQLCKVILQRVAA